MNVVRVLLVSVVAVLAAPAPAQTWQETCGQTAAGVVALRQAVKDAGSDSLVLVVASHPDDGKVTTSTAPTLVME